MRFLVLQHAAVEHPGVLRDYLRADGIPWDAVELDHGAPIPPLDRYDALMALGGPMDVWQEDQHPWLRDEKAAIRQWVSEKRAPFLGICLGHQLLADALGGKVRLMSKPEIGVLDVKLTDAGRAAPLFAGMPASFPVLQWHGAEVAELPRGAVNLAESEQCSIQAFQLGELAYGIQYHVEQDEHTVPQWGKIPEYRHALESALGPGGQDFLQQATTKFMERFGAAAKLLYRNFLRLVTSNGRTATP